MAMKTYSIGRDVNCDIVINDATDVVSRRHALLNVTPSGKMTIIDQSSNGTYVNGIRISPNVPVPVTRKDMVSLAHVAKLDWGMVPKSFPWFKICLLIGIGAIIAIFIVFVVKYSRDNAPKNDDNNSVGIEQVDSTEIKQKEVTRLDSIKQVERQDSIRNKEIQRSDSIRDARQKEQKIKKEEKERDKNKEKEKEKNKKEESKDSTNKRVPVVV